MEIHIELMDHAFAFIESIPQKIAFQIFAKIDLLRQFPKMGSPLGPRFPKLKDFREVLYKKSIRIIYEFDEIDSTVYVLMIQECRQNLPLPRDLKRDLPLEE